MLTHVSVVQHSAPPPFMHDHMPCMDCLHAFISYICDVKRLLTDKISWGCLQKTAPAKTGYGINWYGGPVVNNKNGIVVSTFPATRFCNIVDIVQGFDYHGTLY